MRMLGLLLFLPPMVLAIWGLWRGTQGLERRLTCWMAAHAILGACITATALLRWTRLNVGMFPLYTMVNAFFGFRALSSSGGRDRTIATWMMGFMPAVGALGWLLPNGPALTQPIVALVFVLFAGLILFEVSMGEDDILLDSRFWLAGGVLLGQGGGLLPWAARTWGLSGDAGSVALWTVQNAAQYLGYALLSGVFLCKR